MKNNFSITLIGLVALLTSCLPSQAKHLNRLGDQASAEENYRAAISYYSRSLALAPDQNLIRLRLESAQILLRQIYVDKIYELVDRPQAPIGEYRAAWEMSSTLPSLQVEKERIASIRVDLSRRFTKSEPKLRSSTEGHNYFMHLNKMLALVKDSAVQKTSDEVGASLQAEHEQARIKAEQNQQPGLALFHTTAAALFAPRATGLWEEVNRRRQALLQALSVPLTLNVTAQNGQETAHFQGGLRRRVPSLFTLAAKAPLVLILSTRPASITEREVRDRLSAKCQVGTRKEPNPECDSLQRQAETAHHRFESEQRSLEAISARCATEKSATSCTSYVSSARNSLDSAKREADQLDSQVGACPRFLDTPVYQVFFYERRTVYRQAAIVGDLRVLKDGEVVTSRGVSGVSSDQDMYGDGLSCAQIPPEPLTIKSAGVLQLESRERLLDSCTEELLQMRRRLAEQQLAGGDTRDERLDALVRARLVDDSYPLASEELSRSLTSAWGTDFTITQRILR